MSYPAGEPRHRIIPVTATCDECGQTWPDTAHQELGQTTLAEHEWCERCGSHAIQTEEADPGNDW